MKHSFLLTTERAPDVNDYLLPVQILFMLDTTFCV